MRPSEKDIFDAQSRWQAFMRLRAPEMDSPLNNIPGTDF
jgi:hypothetical protein